jgi:hypothetical protein
MVSEHPGVIKNEIGRPAILQLGVAVLVVVSVGLFPAQIQAGGSSFSPETILTEWGTFRCSAIECAQLPRTGLEVYWAPPTLVIIRNHVPLVLRTCDRRPGENRVWDCQSHLTGGTATPSSLDTLWSWVLEPEPDPDEGY